MADQFNADEIFEIAEQIERNGEAFYRRAAAGTGDEKFREVLDGLADMEHRHVAVFTAMRAELRGKKPEWLARFSDADAENEAVLYLRAAAEGKVFDVAARPADELSGSESPADILKTAIGLEKDSIVFYVAMKDRVRAETGKAKLDDIIREEMGHVAVLVRQLDALGG